MNRIKQTMEETRRLFDEEFGRIHHTDDSMESMQNIPRGRVKSFIYSRELALLEAVRSEFSECDNSVFRVTLDDILSALTGLNQKI